MFFCFLLAHALPTARIYAVSFLFSIPLLQERLSYVTKLLFLIITFVQMSTRDFIEISFLSKKNHFYLFKLSFKNIILRFLLLSV